MKIANKENIFKKNKNKCKINVKQFKNNNINSENLQLISFIESIAAEKLLLERNANNYDYDYMRIDFEEFAQSLKSNFDELFKQRLNEVNNRKLTLNFWRKEVKELFKIRKLFLQNILTN